MRRRVFLVMAASASLAGCGGTQSVYAPPVQRPIEAMSRGGVSNAMLDMADPESAAYILGGMREFTEGTGWRWTHERPEVRIPLDRTDGWRFRVDFLLPASNFKATGPVAVSVLINGKLLERTRLVTAGDHFIERPVPAAWVKTAEPVSVAMEIDPPWSDPGPAHEKLGFVLYRVGFVR